MSITAGRAPQLLRRATSRTRTAREPVPKPHAQWVFGFEAASFSELYAGQPDALPANLNFAGHAATLPFADAALQLHAVSARRVGLVLLLVDLGANHDLARIELYGNPLLSPLAQAGRPLCNFGLPTTVGLAVREQPFVLPDLHRRPERGTFYGDFASDFNIRWLTQDLRGLWGWTPLHLPPTFGRYLLFAFAGLAELPRAPGAARQWGLDIQRMVFFPFLEGVDHRPHVEHSPVASRQERFDAGSAYWAQAGVAAPTPQDAQSIGWDPGSNALMLPSALADIVDVSPVVGAVDVYASDLVSTDASTDNRVHLVTQASTDEAPLLEALRLNFPTPRNGPMYGPGKGAPRPDYLMSVWVTNDREAAFSADARHPGWRLVAEEQLVPSAQFPLAHINFVEPVCARWVRLTARPRPASGDSGFARLALRRLSLVRPRHWSYSPEPDEDVQLDTVSLRLRGARLLDDYAYFDGQHGVGVAIELRQDGGAAQELRSFRSLLELIEETHHRVFANSRRVERPVQRYTETSTAHAESSSRSNSQSSGQTSTTVLPEFGNRQVTRSGTITDYTPRPRNNLGSTHFSSLPNVDTVGLTTTRSFQLDLNALAPPQIDPANASLDQVMTTVVDWARQLSNQGAPVSLGIGGNVGANLGASVGVQIGGSLGFSVNAGSQVGGGVTLSQVTGNQGSVTRSETFTLEAQTTQQMAGNNLVTAQTRVDSSDRRQVERRDESEDVRRTGVEVRYGGQSEDLVIVTVPVNRLLRGSAWLDANGRPLAARDQLRVRVDHLPPGVLMDVEFRGRSVPRQRGD